MGIRIGEEDRAGLERVSRYCARHPFAKGRLQSDGNDRVVYQLAKPDREGQSELILSPFELLDRLAELIVPPRRHRNSYWGCLAPHSKMRPYVVLSAGANTRAEDVEADDCDVIMSADSRAGGTNTTNADAKGEGSLQSFYSLWAVMLAKVYEVLPIVCRHCGAEMKPVAVIVNPDALARICKHQGQPQGIPKLAAAGDPPQGEFDFGA